jgi:DNA repair exonuclease SbcCD ATPase subunit
MNMNKLMVSGQYLLWIVIVSCQNAQTQVRLYHTDQTRYDDLYYDCLYYKLPNNQNEYTPAEQIFKNWYQIIRYCVRSFSPREKIYNANRANDLINELRGLLEIVDQRLSDLDNKIADIENIKFRLNRLETKPDESWIAQIIDEDLINKGQQLNDLITDVENLKNMMNMLSKPIITNNDDLKQKALEDYLKEITRQLLRSVSSLKQQLIEQINEAKSLINLLKEKLDELLYAQQQQPSTIHPEALPPRKLIPYVEPVKPLDLLENVWI